MRKLGAVAWMAFASWLLVACGSVAVPGAEPNSDGEIIPGQFIVTLQSTGVAGASWSGLETAAARVSNDHRAAPGRPIRLINGFVAAGLDADDVVALRADPRVASVEPDVVLRVQSTQSDAGWNLDRIDQRLLPLDQTYSYVSTGAGVTVYVVDTGIRSTHQEFEGRLRAGYTAFADAYGTEDCHGHGTHVAGIAAGSVFGVAKGADLVPVRVMGCDGSGSASAIIAGLDWIAANRSGPAVVNMSLGGGTSSALDTAVRNLVASGVTVVVAAGNSNEDACGVSPARVAEALTVGATVSHDVRSSYSNYGACLSLFAPGSAILSALDDGDTSVGLKSGTSMAAPHVTGAAALVLEGAPEAMPAAVAGSLRDAATRDVLGNVGADSPNLLLFVDANAAPPVTEPAPAPDPEPDPEPAPEPDPMPEGPPCTGCELIVGNLGATGEAFVFPNGGTGSYTTRATALHFGWLRGPDGVDFDLTLERQNRGGRWVVVAASEGTTADEEIMYAGKAGTYRWRVLSVQGAGEFELYLSLPQ